MRYLPITTDSARVENAKLAAERDAARRFEFGDDRCRIGQQEKHDRPVIRAHSGKREQERRARQIARGQLKASNGLA